MQELRLEDKDTRVVMAGGHAYNLHLGGNTSRLAWTSSDVTGQLQSYNHKITGGGRDNVAIRKNFFKKSEGMSDNSQNTSCFCSSNGGVQ